MKSDFCYSVSVFDVDAIEKAQSEKLNYRPTVFCTMDASAALDAVDEKHYVVVSGVKCVNSKDDE